MSCKWTWQSIFAEHLNDHLHVCNAGGGSWGAFYDRLVFSKIKARLGGEVKYMTTGVYFCSIQIIFDCVCVYVCFECISVHCICALHVYVCVCVCGHAECGQLTITAC